MSGHGPGLPKQFVDSMRILFDILDERNCGFVKFAEIESRWKEDENKRLPKGVLECISKVTPPNGLLSFERFCAGLKICLLRNRATGTDLSHAPVGLIGANGKPPLPPNHAQAQMIPNAYTVYPNPVIENSPRKSVPSQTVSPTITNQPLIVPIENIPPFKDKQSAVGDFVVRSVPTSPSKNNSSDHNYRPTNTATVRPNRVLQQRTLSMPLLGDNKLSWNSNSTATDSFANTKYLAGTDSSAIYGQHHSPRRTTELRGYKSEVTVTSATSAVDQTSRVVPLNSTGNRDQHPVRDLTHNDRPPLLVNSGGVSGGAVKGTANTARNRRGIMTVLQNWHQGMLNDAAADHKSRSVTFKVDGPSDSVNPPSTFLNHLHSPQQASTLRPSQSSFQLGQQFVDRSRKVATDGADHGGGAVSDGDVNSVNTKDASNNFRRGHPRRREPRRHTLANGIDYNMLKRMKQLEQEKDVLLQGREAVERARSWYGKQLLGVQEKMKYIGQNNQLEYSTEAHQERLNFQMTQIFEANQHLANLVESSERGFPIHMNLAVRQPAMYAGRQRPTVPSPPSPVAAPEKVALLQLKEINHLLSEEVSKKSERIAQLEKEKAALVRELFQARSQGRRETDDTTLM